MLERCSELVERPATVLEVHVGPEQDEVLGVFEQAGAKEHRRLLELSGPAKGVGLHLPRVRIAVLLAIGLVVGDARALDDVLVS